MKEKFKNREREHEMEVKIAALMAERNANMLNQRYFPTLQMNPEK